ncbi:MAG: tRNA (adenosine(37)-N6)-dimethylallyltransferase MiaA [Christensenellales bacterium]
MKEKLLIIGGPSGVGKTSFSLQVADKFNGEIISCDSMQIYKGFNIGTAKIKDEEKGNIKHYLIDICNPCQEFSVCEYKDLAKSIITKLNNEQKLPILVGGTGLYINAILYDYEFKSKGKDYFLREYYQNLANKYGNLVLCNILKEKNIDVGKIHFNDTKRLIRLLETERNEEENVENKISKYDFLYICLFEERDKLYKKLDARVDAMFNDGLVEEVKGLIESGVNFDCQAMQSIGYKEFKGYFDGEITLNDVKDLIKLNTRHYAKRQLTWFRNSRDVLMYNTENGFEDLIKIIGEWLNK